MARGATGGLESLSPSQRPDVRAQVLRRPRQLVLELLRGVARPVRIAQQGAREDHRVGLPERDDLLGLRGLGDEADRTRGNADLAAYRLGEGHLVARPEVDLLV